MPLRSLPDLFYCLAGGSGCSVGYYYCSLWLFTFPTGYTYITGTPKNCGCFGDCLPITSKTSLPEMALTILIGFIIWQQRYIKSLLKRWQWLLMTLLLFFCFGFQWVHIKVPAGYLDCLPPWNNIAEKKWRCRQMLFRTVPLSHLYTRRMEGYWIHSRWFPADFNADTPEFVNRYDKVIRKGRNNQPPIKGLVLSVKPMKIQQALCWSSLTLFVVYWRLWRQAMDGRPALKTYLQNNQDQKTFLYFSSRLNHLKAPKVVK